MEGTFEISYSDTLVFQMEKKKVFGRRDLTKVTYGEQTI